MKYLAIVALALIAIADAQFRFSNPFRGFRVPSFRRPSRPRAPRVIGQSFRPTQTQSFRPTQTFSRPNAQTFSRPNAIFTVQSPSIPVRPSSVSSAPVVNAPVFQTAPATALREIAAPVRPSSVSSAPVVNAPVFQTAPATALREIAAPDMTAVATSTGSSSGSGSSSSGSGSSSSDSGSTHRWQGRNYVLSWREGRNGFSHGAARSYCRGKGMRIVSLDNIQKAQHFLDLVERNNVPYFWAGGQVSSYVFHRKTFYIYLYFYV